MALLARFGLAGIANTLAGYGIILVALFAGASDIAANAMGYAFGLLVSFTLNRRFVFGRSGRPLAQEMTRFLLAFALAYLVNLGVLLGAREVLGQGNPLSQLPAIIAYAAVFFLLSRHFVFARQA